MQYKGEIAYGDVRGRPRKHGIRFHGPPPRAALTSISMLDAEAMPFLRRHARKDANRRHPERSGSPADRSDSPYRPPCRRQRCSDADAPPCRFAMRARASARLCYGAQRAVAQHVARLRAQARGAREHSDTLLCLLCCSDAFLLPDERCLPDVAR